MLRKEKYINIKKIAEIIISFDNIDKEYKKQIEFEKMLHDEELHIVSDQVEKYDTEERYREFKWMSLVSLVWNLNIDELQHVVENNSFGFNKNNIEEFKYIKFLNDELVKKLDIENKLNLLISNNELKKMSFVWDNYIDRINNPVNYKRMFLDCPVENLTNEGKELLNILNVLEKKAKEDYELMHQDNKVSFEDNVINFPKK